MATTFGVPALIGAGGVERVVDFKLTSEESALFEESVNHVKSLVTQVNDMLAS